VKFKLYTKSHNEDLLKAIDNNGKQFTEHEHEYVVKKELGNLNREEYLSLNNDKPHVIDWLTDYIKKNNFKNIISMGAGNCFLEYKLKCKLPECNITATDFDSFFIDKSKEFFPSINSIKFDFFKDNVESLKSEFDLAIFLGSTYVMDDSQFINLFSQFKAIGTRQIIDFQGGYIEYRDVPIYFASNILRKLNIIKSYRGKFHGYGRTKDEFERIYKKLGIGVIETHIEPYKHVAICKL